MGYEEWNEIEDDDQDELQDASVGQNIVQLSHTFTRETVV
jgi:hypothetical protein